MGELLNIKPLSQIHKRKIGDYLKEAWYFDSFIEKMILVILGFLGMWKILEFFM